MLTEKRHHSWLAFENLHSDDDRSDHPSEDDALWQARMDTREQLLERNELLGWLDERLELSLN